MSTTPFRTYFIERRSNVNLLSFTIAVTSAVNRAARAAPVYLIEVLNWCRASFQPEKIPVIIGEPTHRAAPDFAAVEIDRVIVRGRETPVTIFALVGDEAMKTDPTFQEFAALHADLMAAKRTGEHSMVVDLARRCEQVYPQLAEFYRIVRREAVEA